MLIKAADDKQPQIAALEALLARPDVDAGTRRRIEQEIRTIWAGASGERDAAYEIEFLFGDNPNRMTIHDLRIELDGRVAQIDHLIITRLLDIWVCESKHFSEGVSINEQGEWVAFYGRRPYGIPSPVEQNRRHLAVLADVFAKGVVPLPTRLGITLKPHTYSLILVSNGARISRPKGRKTDGVDGLETVIKVERLNATMERAIDQHSVLAIGKAVGKDTIETLARRLAALHVPATADWAARFGLPPEPRRAAPDPPPAVLASGALSSSPAPASANGPATTCATCGRRVSEAVVAFCRDRPARFGDAIYCMVCQRQVPRA